MILLLAAVLSLFVGLSLGLLGGGGSILTVPILVYVLGVEAKEAIATSLVVVGFTSAFAVIPHARQGNVVWRVGLLFSVAGMIGAYLGGLAASWFSGTTLLVLFAVMMVATGVAMLRGRKEREARDDAPLVLWKIAVEGVIVGIVTGLVGAGGGFLVVPALALLGGLDMRKAVGTSLLVIALKSFAGYAGHAAHVGIDLPLTATVTGAAIVGSFGGSRLAGAIPPAQLRRIFGVFVLVMAAFLLYKELGAG